jgi:hypothetical protein
MIALRHCDYVEGFSRIEEKLKRILGEQTHASLFDMDIYRRVGCCTSRGNDTILDIHNIEKVYLFNCEGWDLQNRCYIPNNFLMLVPAFAPTKKKIEDAVDSWIVRLAAEKRVGFFKTELLALPRFSGGPVE